MGRIAYWIEYFQRIEFVSPYTDCQASLNSF